MSADPSRVELLLHDDRRLLAAVGATVTFAGQRVGLSDREQANLAAAASEACAEAFSLAHHNGHRDSTLRVVVSDFANRVEVAIENPAAHAARTGGQHAASGEQYTSVAAALRHSAVDRVQNEVYNNRPWTILIKYLAAERPRHQA
ncbi:MAG TPA: hypothetical protein VMH00_11710 [Candidatus Limnocylindrales bacterium]|nr:hypothetical protein [Candidatus Limnocylindrales bacterium]